jgi:alpha-N-arabinofuranosidase
VDSEAYPISATGLRADFARNDQVPYLDVMATSDPPGKHVSVFILNRDLESERELALDWHDAVPSRVVSCETLTGPDLKAFNTFDQPGIVAPRPLEAPRAAANMTLKLPPRSYTVIQFATA